MKPFTLEWWFDLYEQSCVKSEYADIMFSNNMGKGNVGIANKWKDKAMRYARLNSWIYNRIIKKYGEK